MMREQMPYLQAVAHMLADWAAANPDAQLPRSVGITPFAIDES